MCFFELPNPTTGAGGFEIHVQPMKFLNIKWRNKDGNRCKHGVELRKKAQTLGVWPKFVTFATVVGQTQGIATMMWTYEHEPLLPQGEGRD